MAHDGSGLSCTYFHMAERLVLLCIGERRRALLAWGALIPPDATYRNGIEKTDRWQRYYTERQAPSPPPPPILSPHYTGDYGIYTTGIIMCSQNNIPMHAHLCPATRGRSPCFRAIHNTVIFYLYYMQASHVDLNDGTAMFECVAIVCHWEIESSLSRRTTKATNDT